MDSQRLLMFTDPRKWLENLPVVRPPRVYRQVRPSGHVPLDQLRAQCREAQMQAVRAYKLA